MYRRDIAWLHRDCVHKSRLWFVYFQDRLTVFPSIYLAYAHARPKFRDRNDNFRSFAVDAECELVIEGFPRSGNSFAVAAFRQAQRRPVRIAHHLHAAAQVLGASRLGIPVLLLIRNPSAAITSIAVKRPGLSIPWAIRSYIRFYETVLPVIDDVIVVPFSVVISDFGSAIARMNSRCGTSFTLFPNDGSMTSAVMSEIDQSGLREASRSGRSFELSVGRPSTERELAKVTPRAIYWDPAHQPLRRRAEAIYKRILSHSDLT